MQQPQAGRKRRGSATYASPAPTTHRPKLYHSPRFPATSWFSRLAFSDMDNWQQHARSAPTSFKDLRRSCSARFSTSSAMSCGDRLHNQVQVSNNLPQVAAVKLDVCAPFCSQSPYVAPLPYQHPPDTPPPRLLITPPTMPRPDTPIPHLPPNLSPHRYRRTPPMPIPGLSPRVGYNYSSLPPLFISRETTPQPDPPDEPALAADEHEGGHHEFTPLPSPAHKSSPGSFILTDLGLSLVELEEFDESARLESENFRHCEAEVRKHQDRAFTYRPTRMRKDKRKHSFPRISDPFGSSDHAYRGLPIWEPKATFGNWNWPGVAQHDEKEFSDNGYIGSDEKDMIDLDLDDDGFSGKVENDDLDGCRAPRSSVATVRKFSSFTAGVVEGCRAPRSSVATARRLSSSTTESEDDHMGDAVVFEEVTGKEEGEICTLAKVSTRSCVEIETAWDSVEDLDGGVNIDGEKGDTSRRIN